MLAGKAAYQVSLQQLGLRQLRGMFRSSGTQRWPQVWWRRVLRWVSQSRLCSTMQQPLSANICYCIHIGHKNNEVQIWGSDQVQTYLGELL